jgi:hypothetical protein
MLSVLKKIGIVGLIAFVFLFGVVTTVYLSLRSPAVTVPEIVGKDRSVAENDLREAGLNFRVRASRPSRQVKPDTIMFQLPPAGQVVKAGQTVAVDISRVPKDGEASENVAGLDNTNAASDNENHNANESAAPANLNENKPKKNKNTNGNKNSNANGNRNANANRSGANANANARPHVNANNANSTSTGANSNSHKPKVENSNVNRPNRNANRATPKPTPPERR